MTLEALTRWAVYLPALGALGIAGARWLRSRVGGEAATLAREEAALRRWAVACGVLLVLATSARALAQTVAAFGFADLSPESLRLVALESRWAGRWHWQMGAALLVLFGHACGLRWGAGRALGAAAALAFACALPLTGHAAGHPVRWLAQSVHALGAGAWVGTLAIVALITLGSAATARERRERLLLAFAPLAAAGVVAVVAAGIFLAWQTLPSPSDLSSLWTTTWGRLLVVKAAAALGVAGLGALNHRRLRQPGRTGVARGVLAELVLALLVLALTGWLTSAPPPEAG
jgi:putative copper export protein